MNGLRQSSPACHYCITACSVTIGNPNIRPISTFTSLVPSRRASRRWLRPPWRRAALHHASCLARRLPWAWRRAASAGMRVVLFITAHKEWQLSGIGGHAGCIHVGGALHRADGTGHARARRLYTRRDLDVGISSRASFIWWRWRRQHARTASHPAYRLPVAYRRVWACRWLRVPHRGHGADAMPSHCQQSVGGTRVCPIE